MSRCVGASLLVLIGWVATGWSTSPLFAERPGSSDQVAPIRNLEALKAHAQALAREAYVPAPALPKELAELEYDEFRLIAFRPDRALWYNSNRPYWVELFHRGYVYRDPVQVNIVGPKTTVQVPYRPDYFEFRGTLRDLSPPENTGFGGMRVIGNFPQTTDGQELLVCAGSSYFRARTYDHPYGTSTRGLAVDVGLNKDEEFPVFREFWLVEPSKGDATVTILALMDSPSVTGAYRLVLTPGKSESTVDVTATCYFRKTPERVGIAPLTSMWMWGDGLAGPAGDHRPSVHDADGLAILGSKGELFWRALSRQAYPSVVSFDQPDGIEGFGLIQRDRTYDHYFDDEAQYHLRPSVWIEPKSDWGAGRVGLLELDSPHEGIDNIAAWWEPATPVSPGTPLDLDYRVTYFHGDHAAWKQVGRAIQTRVHRPDPERPERGPITIEIDFAGPDLVLLDKDAVIEADLLTISNRVLESSIERGPLGQVTLKLVVEPDDVPAIGLEATLRVEDEPITETWNYLCTVKAPPVSLPPWRLKELGLLPNDLPKD